MRFGELGDGGYGLPRALCALAMTGVLQGVRWAAGHMGPALRMGYKKCVQAGRRGRRPLRRATRGAEEESPSHGFAVPAPFRQGGHGDGGCGVPHQ